MADDRTDPPPFELLGDDAEVCGPDGCALPTAPLDASDGGAGAGSDPMPPG